MINLITGVPGSGKSVYAMTFMLEAVKEGRPIYVHGIPNLKINHTLVVCGSPSCEVCPQAPPEPVEPEHAKFDSEIDYNSALFDYRVEETKYLAKKAEFDKYLKADEWHIWSPNGAFIFYDEVQNVYRPRSSSGKVPPSVAAFETHRHKGLDFYLVTQSPLLFDGNIRRLVGKHIHLRPTWAGRYQYEYPECNDNPKNTSSGIKSGYKLNKKVFSLYKSASLHTKQTKKIPFAVYLILGILVLFAFIGYRISSRYDAISNPDAVGVSDTSAAFSSVPDNSPHDNQSTNESLLVDDTPEKFKITDLLDYVWDDLNKSDLSRLPSSCLRLTKSTVKCFIPSYLASNFPTNVCTSKKCYTLIKIKGYDYKPPNDFERPTQFASSSHVTRSIK